MATGLAVDGDDIVYITEFEGVNVQRVTPSGGISTCAGTGKQVRRISSVRRRVFLSFAGLFMTPSSFSSREFFRELRGGEAGEVGRGSNIAFDA